VLAVFQNLFGLAAGPLITGLLSDKMGLEFALAVMPCFAVLSALAFITAARTYETDTVRASMPAGASDTVGAPQGAAA
jgi:hypothetical protein